MAEQTRGERVIAFIETYCRIPEGEHVGRPMVLGDFQRRFILDIYDNPVGTRRAYLSIARKNGKSGLIAAMLLAHICGPEAQLNTQIVSGAMSRDQAALVHALASKMIGLDDRLQAVTRIVPSTKRIIGLARNVEYRALAAEGKTAHGLSPVLAILDEVGQVRGPRSEFIDAIITSQGAHATPLLVAISTQAPGDGDLFSVWLDDAATSGDPRIVSHVYAADPEADLLDQAAWAAANPALGTFRSLEDAREQAERAARMPSFEPTFRNLVLNQRVETSAPFISRSVWRDNRHEPEEAAFVAGPVYVGIDLSARNDLTAMAMVSKHEGLWHARLIVWTPADTLLDRERRDRAPYSLWVREGWLRAIPGVAIDYETVAREIGEELGGYAIKAVAFDRWRFELLQKELKDLNIELPLMPFGQGFKDMTPALEALETILLNKQLAHGYNPVLTMCMANTRVDMDAAGNRKLNKAKSTGRIDGAVALAMAIGIAAADSDEDGDFDDFLANAIGFTRRPALSA